MLLKFLPRDTQLSWTCTELALLPAVSFSDEEDLTALAQDGVPLVALSGFC